MDCHKWCVGLAMVSGLHIICLSPALCTELGIDPDELWTKDSLVWQIWMLRAAVLARVTWAWTLSVVTGGFKDLFGRWTLTERDRQTYKWITKEQHAGWHILPVTSHWNNLSAELRGSRIVTYFISMHTQEMFQMLNSCSTFVLPGDVIILNRM